MASIAARRLTGPRRLANTIHRCLPETRGTAVVRQLQVQLDRSATRWKELADMDSAAIEAAAGTLRLTGHESLRAQIPAKRGVVLTGLHMGEYLLAALRLLLLVGERELVIVRRLPEDALEQRVFAHLRDYGIDARVLRTTESDIVRPLLRTLRRGGAAVLLFDLPPSYGDADEVRFLGRDCFWVRGPVVCAAAAGAALVPYFAYRDQGLERCDVLPPIGSVGSGAPGVPSAPVVQTLVQHAERYIARFPSQWLHWEQFEPALIVGASRAPAT